MGQREATALSEDSQFEVQFWGVRGGIPCSGLTTARYGGNTACVEMRVGRHLLIFDAGTGIRPLGKALDARAPVTGDVFFSHTGFERIAGFPFFSAAYNPRNRFRFWAGHLPPGRGIRDVFTGLMAEPVFPVPIDVMEATLEFNDFRAGEALSPVPGLRMLTASLNHPTAVTGYRIEWRGKCVCYVSDLMPAPDGDEASVRPLLAGADVAIVNIVGAETAGWRDGLRLCEAAGVRTCVLFHHDPDGDDDAMDSIAAEAESLRPGTVVAREGMTLAP